MILDKGKGLAVMIDMQERLVPAIVHREELVENCRIFLEGLKVLGVPIIATQQYTKGLGETLPELKEVIPDSHFIEKITFSSWGEENFRTAIKDSGAKQIMIFGTETHICVQQTVLDMLEAGFEVMLIADCAGSRFDSDRELALRRMTAAGVAVTSYESALFELTKQGGTDTFKAISKLVKSRTH